MKGVDCSYYVDAASMLLEDSQIEKHPKLGPKEQRISLMIATHKTIDAHMLRCRSALHAVAHVLLVVRTLHSVHRNVYLTHSVPPPNPNLYTFNTLPSGGRWLAQEGLNLNGTSNS